MRKANKEAHTQRKKKTKVIVSRRRRTERRIYLLIDIYFERKGKKRTGYRFKRKRRR
jgi:hypothetical protein